jgi:hypothetical protein
MSVLGLSDFTNAQIPSESLNAHVVLLALGEPWNLAQLSVASSPPISSENFAEMPVHRAPCASLSVDMYKELAR